MFVQRVITRLLLIMAVFIIGLTGIVYAAGHISDSPMIMAYVEPVQSSRQEGPVAYLIDPMRLLNIPIEPPFETSSFYPDNMNHLADEPGVLYLTESNVNEDQRTTTTRFYRYDARTGENNLVYENTIQRQLLFYIPNYQLWRSPDGRYYAFWDQEQNRLVAINTATLISHIVWRGEAGQRWPVRFQVNWSPDGQRIAFIADDQEPEILVVNISGEILSRIPIDPEARWSAMEVTWLPDNRHVLLGNLYTSEQINIIRVYDTVSGEVNAFTESLKGTTAQYLSDCQYKGDWISFAMNMQEKVIYLLNLSTGEMREVDVSYDPNRMWVPFLTPNPDCSTLIHRVFGPSESTINSSDVYLTTLEGERPRKVLSDVYTPQFDGKNTLIYAEANEARGYDVYRLFLDGTDRVEPVVDNMPTASVVWAADFEDGWYTFLENDWSRSASVMPPVRGNPVIYYDIDSRDVRLLTPPGVRIMFAQILR